MSERLDKLEQLFNAALDLDSAEERAAYLARACGDDTALQRQVEGLLRAHETAGPFLDPDTPSPHDSFPSAGAELPLPEKRGEKIGHYTLVEKVGEGGHCVVYRAEQTEPVRRQVALKLIKAGMDTRQVVARFEAERQALALMEHPHIAKVFDAGVTATGRPYFVMELVRGVPITRFCDQQRLTIQQRLDLFTQVVHAVQHAHQKGVIHRDLKPSNILVATDETQPEPAKEEETSSSSKPPTTTQGPPFPKIIDFGIAKAMQARLSEREVVTWFGQFVGTPAYMSPEQTAVNSEDIDARADIYSLGALLYELLTGVTPFQDTLARADYDEIRRIIQQTEPLKPSARLHASGDRLVELAKARQTEPGLLWRAVQGDLDWIVMKALEKDRQRRYATANDLAEDIQRHLAHQPVLAGPPTAAYRARKFVRRHRVGMGVSAVITVALVAGLCVALVGLRRALRAEEQMRQERDRALKAEADMRGILALFDERLVANDNLLPHYAAVVRLARERLQTTNPAAVNLIMPLAHNLGRMGAWSNALEVYLWMTEATPWSCDMWTRAHLAALASDQPEVRRQLARQIAKRFGQVNDPITCMQVARGLLIDPDHQEFLRVGVDSAKRAFQGYPDYCWCQVVTGIAEYRQGNWSAALRVLEALEHCEDARAVALACCFGAMARYQTGQPEAARETLKRGSEQLRRLLQTGFVENHEWHSIVAGLVARNEAEQLILGGEVSPPVTLESMSAARASWKSAGEKPAH